MDKAFWFEVGKVTLLLLMFSIIAWKSYDLGEWNGRVKQCEMSPGSHLYFDRDFNEWICQTEKEHNLLIAMERN